MEIQPFAMWDPEKKQWIITPFDKLPKGAIICKYDGPILDVGEVVMFDNDLLDFKVDRQTKQILSGMWKVDVPYDDHLKNKGRLFHMMEDAETETQLFYIDVLPITVNDAIAQNLYPYL